LYLTQWRMMGRFASKSSDVALDEVKAFVAEERPHPLGLQVHAVDRPVRISQDVLAQVVADEAVDPENENVFQDEPLGCRPCEIT
jgi:hypothetical protein